ncbi:MAG: phosphoribosylformylglycinamidine synthase I [Anaerolineales bacterium]|nr:phosphoribosylformylglycinamidine synthase I [Anaerolineales bacterium]
MKPTALILHANGTNRDHEAAQALELAGAAVEIVHLSQLRAGERHMADYQLLVLPGGFSYGDALGAGKLMALDLTVYFADAVHEFIASGKPVIGICNGFQALVKAGLLPGSSGPSSATLTFNASGRFECRWVTLAPQPGACVWTNSLVDIIECPVAHGEGRFLMGDSADLVALQAGGQVALTYAFADGAPAGDAYPANPNGSVAAIAGVCNAAGNVLGLMPHPEDHLFSWQHPRWTRGRTHGLGLPLFQRGVAHAVQAA